MNVPANDTKVDNSIQKDFVLLISLFFSLVLKKWWEMNGPQILIPSPLRLKEFEVKSPIVVFILKNAVNSLV